MAVAVVGSPSSKLLDYGTPSLCVGIGTCTCKPTGEEVFFPADVGHEDGMGGMGCLRTVPGLAVPSCPVL